MTEQELFLAAIEITDAVERSAWLKKACGGDQELLHRVEALLLALPRADELLPNLGFTKNHGDPTTPGIEATERAPPGVHRKPGEAEFGRYLEAATRPGWLGRLAHYEIEFILGRGAFGIVAKAFDEKLHRVVAIKMLCPELTTTSPPRKRFLREARAAAAVTHENIAAIYAVEEDPIPYLVMEYVPGRTLQQELDDRGPLPVDEVLRIGLHIAEGLAAAHAAHLIHRDIKPSNILLTEGPVKRAKLSDFGLARAVDDASMTSSGAVAGTPLYMSPEQARGEALDHRSDLFSLGSVLYQMTTGRPPFRATNTVAVLKRVCEDSPRPLSDVLPDIPDWLETVIFRLLRKQPDARYQSARDVADLLARRRHDGFTAVHKTVAATAPQVAGRITRASRPVSQLPLGTMPWLAAAVLLATAVTAALIYSRQAFLSRPDTAAIPNSRTATLSSGPFATKTETARKVVGWHGWPTDAPAPAIAPFDAAQARKHQEEWATYLKLPVEYENSIGMKFRLIPPGEFLMGSTADEIQAVLQHVPTGDKPWREGVRSEEPRHTVVLTQPSYLSVTEVTQDAYERLMGVNPSYFSREGRGRSMLGTVSHSTLPVETVSWNDAVGFCLRLSRREGLSPAYTRLYSTTRVPRSTGYHLPSEALWEYGCAAGTTTRYFTGNSDITLARGAWFDLNANSRTHSVGTLQPNAFGLYDMHGNVWEWVEDGWDPRSYLDYDNAPAVNPSSSFEASSRCVMRGGKYDDVAMRSRTANRDGASPEWRQMVLGFRVALSTDAVRESLAREDLTHSSSDSAEDILDHTTSRTDESGLLNSSREQGPETRKSPSISLEADLVSVVALNFEAADRGFPEATGPQVRVSFVDRAIEMTLLEGGLWWSDQPALHDLQLDEFVCEVTGQITASADWCAWGIGILPAGEARAAWTGIGLTSDSCVFARRYDIENLVAGQPLPLQSDVFMPSRLRVERRRGQLRVFVDDRFIKELSTTGPSQCRLTVYLTGQAGAAARFTSVRIWTYRDGMNAISP